MSVPSRQARVRGRDEPTHGRHCRCSACKQEDWTNPRLAPCGMHGPKCPRLYDPWPPAPVSRPVDEALSVLAEAVTETEHFQPFPDAREALATVQAEIERLREERDERLSVESADRWLAHRFHEVCDERDRLLHRIVEADATAVFHAKKRQDAEKRVWRLEDGLREVLRLALADRDRVYDDTAAIEEIVGAVRALLAGADERQDG